MYKQIREAVPHLVVAFRTKNTVTLVSQYPYKHIQIILRLYRSTSEVKEQKNMPNPHTATCPHTVANMQVLVGFDVDCCSVAYDGTNVWATPRAHNAIVSQ